MAFSQNQYFSGLDKDEGIQNPWLSNIDMGISWGIPFVQAPQVG
jgi:hypothetical protein